MDDHDLGALWNAALRSMRAQRPSLASKGARARTFGAGLEQAEQLWAASDRVGPIASPLLLFYGLTQAGRAICAAGVRTPSWEGAQNHGLKFKLSRPTEESLLSLKEVRVAANGNGLIHDVAQVLASPVLASEVCFSDLLSALDCPLFFEDDQFTEHRPLEVQEDGMLMATHRDPVRKSLYIGPLPEALACRREQVPAGARNLAYTRALPPSAEEVDEWLASYPRLHRLRPPEVVPG